VYFFDSSNKQERYRFVSNAYSHKLLVNPTDERSVRIRPNLAFSDNELDELLNKINIAKR
jgi:acetylornithine/succinyldiaminopimelate/putrescine aminotransferase